MVYPLKILRMFQFMSVVWLLLIIASCSGGHFELAHADDPLNKPLDSVGVSGYDRTLCSDKWNDCSAYDRQQFDTRYPGSSLDDLSLYPLSYSGDDGIGDGLQGLTDTQTHAALLRSQARAEMEKDAPRDAWARRRWLEKKRDEAARLRDRRWSTPQQELRSDLRERRAASPSALPCPLHQHGESR